MQARRGKTTATEQFPEYIHAGKHHLNDTLRCASKYYLQMSILYEFMFILLFENVEYITDTLRRVFDKPWTLKHAVSTMQ